MTFNITQQIQMKKMCQFHFHVMYETSQNSNLLQFVTTALQTLFATFLEYKGIYSVISIGKTETKTFSPQNKT